MVFGIIGMVNFAHGDVFMVSAFIALVAYLILSTMLGISSIALTLFIVLDRRRCYLHRCVNWTIERLAYRPLRGSFRLAPLISAIGMSIFLSNFVQVTQGPRNKSIPPMVQGEFVLFTKNDYGRDPLATSRLIIWGVTCGTARLSFGTSSPKRRSAARNALANRTRRWPRWSASTSIGPYQ